MSKKVKLERQKVFCKFCGKEMTAENECDFNMLPFEDYKAQVCCNDCMSNDVEIVFSMPEARSVCERLGYEGIKGIDFPYPITPPLTEEELDALEYEHEARIIEYATRDRSYVGDWIDGDE